MRSCGQAGPGPVDKSEGLGAGLAGPVDKGHACSGSCTHHYPFKPFGAAVGPVRTILDLFWVVLDPTRRPVCVYNGDNRQKGTCCLRCRLPPGVISARLGPCENYLGPLFGPSWTPPGPSCAPFWSSPASSLGLQRRQPAQGQRLSPLQASSGRHLKSPWGTNWWQSGYMSTVGHVASLPKLVRLPRSVGRSVGRFTK